MNPYTKTRLLNNTYKIIRSQYLLPISEHKSFENGKETRIEDGYVLIKNDKILEVGKFNEDVEKRILNDTEIFNNLEIIGEIDENDVTKSKIPKNLGVLLPGFVKAHGHDDESPIIGCTRDKPLTEWLDHSVNVLQTFMTQHEDELREEFNVEPYFLTQLKGKCDDLSYGITTSLTHQICKNYVPELVDADVMLGITNIIAVGSQDRNFNPLIIDNPYTVALDRLNNYHERFKHLENVEIIPGPHAFFSNSPELLKELKDWSREHNTLFHLHSSEEPNTTAWFRETYGMTPVEYGLSIDVLDPMTILGHQVNNTSNDLQILKDTGTNVVHNPLANTILGSGMPPIIEMMDLGIPVCISTDGSGSADNQSIIVAARTAAQFQKAFHQDASLLPSQKLLESITCDAAAMLRVNKGSLEPGKDADFVLFDLDNLNTTPTLIENLVENIIWASNGNEIKYVMANGKIVIDDYQFVDVNTEKLKQDMNSLTSKFYEFRKTFSPINATGHNKFKN